VEELGGSVRRVSLPSSHYGIATYYLLAPAECSANLARFDGIRYGPRLDDAEDLLEHYELTRGRGFGPEVKRRIMLGTFALASGYYDAYYARAQKVRTLIMRDFTAAFEDVDFVVSPTSPTTAFRIGERTADPYSMYLSDVCTIPVSLAGIPAISIPCGLSDGLPVGLQIAGPAFSENRLFDAAHALEGAIGFSPSPPGVA
jgi:aspartyl-tRNA(Asn)/glutamyl-tRNA(Gln) amidotransferase subunit A